MVFGSDHGDSLHQRQGQQPHLQLGRQQEDAEPGSSILQVEATDLNTENNRDIEYSINNRAKEYFGIYSNMSLYSRRGLDREDKPRPQWFSVCLT